MNVKQISKNAWLILVLVSTLLVISCSVQGDTWARVEETGVLRVGIDPTFPPFEVVDENGNPFGLDVDLLRAVAADLGVEAAETAVYVGDDPASDMVGGRSAGMLTVFCVGNGRFSPPDNVIPHAKIDDLAALPSLLERRNKDE